MYNHYCVSFLWFLLDFGLAKQFDANLSKLKSYCGTPQYFSPEVKMLLNIMGFTIVTL